MTLLKDRPLMKFPWSKKEEEPKEYPIDSKIIIKTVEQAYNDAYLEARGWGTTKKNREMIRDKLNDIKMEKMIRKIIREEEEKSRKKS